MWNLLKFQAEYEATNTNWNLTFPLQSQAMGRNSCWVAYSMNHNRNGSRGAKTLMVPKNNVLIFNSHYASVCPSRLGGICHHGNEPIVC